MKIGMVCYPTYGGSGVIATELGLHLVEKSGYEVHFICYNMPSRLKFYGWDKIRFHLVDVVSYPLFQFPPYTLALASKIFDVAMGHTLDIVHVHYAIPHTAAAEIAREMIGGSDMKIVTTLHGTDIRLIGLDPSYRSVTRHSLEKSDRVTAVSDFLRRITMEEFSLEKEIAVIPNFVDTEKFKRCFDENVRQSLADRDEKIIIHVSNFREVKNVPVIIDVFEKVQRKVKARLVLIGEGPDFDLCRKMVKEKGLAERVVFLGNVDDVVKIISVSDLFLLASETESFGLAAVEALSCGVPVVSFDVGGLNEVLGGCECGYLVEYMDLEEMVDACIDVLSDEQKRMSMAEKGRDLVVNRYNQNKIVSMYEKLYHSLAGS